MESRISQTHSIHTRRGQKYIIQVRHEGLHKFQEVKGDNAYVVQQKARGVANQWDEMWAKKSAEQTRQASIKNGQQLATQRTIDAEKDLNDLSNILNHTLSVNDAINWESLKNNAIYPIRSPLKEQLPPAPTRNDAKYEVKVGFFESLFGGRAPKEAAAQKQFESDLLTWQQSKTRIDNKHANDMQEWEKARDQYLVERDVTNQAIEAQKQDYFKGNDLKPL